MEPAAKQPKERERGAIIVEATITLSIFMFAMFMFLSLIQLAYTQSRMSVALGCATKEIAEYAHLYYVTGMNESFSGSGGKSSELINEVADFITEIGGNLGSLDSELGQYVTDAGEAMSGDSLADIGKGLLGQQLVLQMMKKNLVSGLGDNADAWLKRNHVEDVDLMESKFLEGESADIFMRVNYKIKVVDLLKLDYSFQLSSVAYTQAWKGESSNSGGGGDSGGESGG